MDPVDTDAHPDAMRPMTDSPIKMGSRRMKRLATFFGAIDFAIVLSFVSRVAEVWLVNPRWLTCQSLETRARIHSRSERRLKNKRTTSGTSLPDS